MLSSEPQVPVTAEEVRLDHPVWALGLMSGTSLDGIDAALIRSDGRARIETGPFLTRPYPESFRARLRACLGRSKPLSAVVGDGLVASVERDLTTLHAEAVRDVLAEAGLAPSSVAVVGFHGHTLFHAPEQGLTWQIGDGAALATATGIGVVADFRSADVAAGGQGAPLVPLYHQALATELGKPLAVLNIGGVANVTWLGDDGTVSAFDTGPGNALLDDWMHRYTGVPCDRDGIAGAAGRRDPTALAALLDHPYFRTPFPKSLDRDAFSPHLLEGLSVEDGAATLTAFTAASVAAALPHLPHAPQRWLVTGGGRHNPTLMQALRRYLAVPVDPVDVVGWNGDALEAQAFAWLALRSRQGLPLSVPSTTGVPRPLTGGRWFPAL